MKRRIDVGKVQAAHVQFAMSNLPWWWRLRMAWSGTLHLLVEVTPQNKVRVTALKITQRPMTGGPVAVP